MGAAAQMRCGPPQTLPADCRSQVCGFPQSARLAARLASLIMRNFLARRLRVAAGVLLGSLSAVAELAMTLASGLWLLVTLGRSARTVSSVSISSAGLARLIDSAILSDEK